MLSIALIEIGVALIAIVIIIELLHKKSMKLMFLFSVIVLILLGIVMTFTLIEPKIEIEDNLELEVKTSEKLKSPKTTYFFNDITENVKVIGNVDYNKVGTYEVEYEYSTPIRKFKKSQVINVVDKTAPEITLKGEKEVNQSYLAEYKEQGYSAIDNCDRDLTEGVKVEKNKIDDNHLEIKYSVSDSSGNVATAIRKINLVDKVKPVITLNGSSKITLEKGDKYKEYGAKAIDEKDGDLTSKIVILGEVNTSKAGKYKITYKVLDTNGNEAIKVREVVVEDNDSTQNKEIQSIDKTETAGNSGVVYLTFDDGPSSSITPKILDILKKKNVKATFFILNYDSKEEKIVKRIYNEGHTIAIHGYSHEYKEIYKSEEAYMQNLTKLQEKIKNTTGYTATITRFPGGSSNSVSKFNPGIMTKLSKKVVESGFKYFDWNVSSGDAGGAKNSTQVYNNVTKGLKKSRSNVVLMHDFSGNKKTLNALEDIIDYGLKNGYKFQKITESTPMVTHSVNN